MKFGTPQNFPTIWYVYMYMKVATIISDNKSYHRIPLSLLLISFSFFFDQRFINDWMGSQCHDLKVSGSVLFLVVPAHLLLLLLLLSSFVVVWACS